MLGILVFVFAMVGVILLAFCAMCGEVSGRCAHTDLVVALSRAGNARFRHGGR